MKWLDSITDSVDVSLSKLRKTVEDGGAWCAAVHGVTRSQTHLGTEHQQEQICHLCFLVCSSFKTPVNAERIWQPVSIYDFFSFHHT